MLKYFTITAGFATLVSASYIFLKGIGFYVALVLSLFLSIGTILAWYQSDRSSRLKTIAYPLLIALLKHMGADGVPIIIEIAKHPGMKNEVICVLVEALQAKPDPTERYWIYVALGMIDSRKSKLAVKKGLSDENEFACMGAEKAWKLIKSRMKGRQHNGTRKK